MCTGIALLRGIVSLIAVAPLCFCNNRVLIRQHSYLAKIQYSPLKRGEKPLRCTGVVISANWIVTSAKCALYSWRRQNGNRTHDYADILCAEDTPLPTCKPQDASHYRYVVDVALPVGLENTIHGPLDSSLDIAMLKVNSPFQFSKHFKPIRLPKSPEHCEPSKAYSVGWTGDDNASEASWSNGLQKIDLDIVNDRDCAEKFPDLDVSTVVCARAAKNTKSASQFACDSHGGGPLVKIVDLTLKKAQVSQSYPFLCGILRTSNCGQADAGREWKIEYYTDILRHVMWIARVLKQPVAPPQVADTAVKTEINLLQGDTTTRLSR